MEKKKRSSWIAIGRSMVGKDKEEKEDGDGREEKEKNKEEETNGLKLRKISNFKRKINTKKSAEKYMSGILI